MRMASSRAPGSPGGTTEPPWSAETIAWPPVGALERCCPSPWNGCIFGRPSMRTLALAVFFGLAATPPCRAQQQVIPDSVAAKYVGQTVTVEGTVVSVG